MLNETLAVGGDIVMTLAEYDPDNIICDGKSRPVASDCMKAIEQMPVSEKPSTFGLKGEPRIDVELPQMIADGRKCIRSLLLHQDWRSAKIAISQR